VGFLKQQSKAIIWKGPLVHYMIQQMIGYIKWGNTDLDVLLIDFPPGTGDTQLSLCQLLKIDGAIIVSTPQDVALEDVRRGIDMFKQLAVPIIGLVENMSHYHCPSCGHKDFIFGEDGFRKIKVQISEDLEVPIPLLGQIPLQRIIRETSDSGKPIVLSDPTSRVTQAYREIAEKLHTGLQRHREKQQQTKYSEE